MTPHPQWKIERIDIGMGDHEYLIQRNGVDICHTPDHHFALIVCRTMARSESTPVPAAPGCPYWAKKQESKEYGCSHIDAVTIRNQTLDEIQSWSDEIKSHYNGHSVNISTKDIDALIKSLRTTAQQPERGDQR